ncbi:MAG: hypothetical protein LQ341_003236 [Variospora aurantia]|nr:MAG: hypothetical protein LQ341_003236 [Variospora aurantia]
MNVKILVLASPRCPAFRVGLYRLTYSQCRVCRNSRAYPTHDLSGRLPTPSRKQVTVTNDDGRVHWKELSVKEKVARTTQQTFNFGIILTGLLMTGGCGYFLYTEVISTDSKTVQFNRAVDRIRSDSRVKEALGSDHKIRAFGEPTWNRWARARPIASNRYKDSQGTEHFTMHFNAEGSSRRGIVNLHTFKAPGKAEWEYKFLALDVEGQPRIYLENSDFTPRKDTSRVNFLGMQLRK